MLPGKGGMPMSENGRDLVLKMHQEAVEQYREQKRKERELVEAAFREALARQREKEEQERALVEQVHREAIEQGSVQYLPPGEAPRGVHHSELPEAKAGDPLAEEWNTYRREVGRWLAEGLEGRHVLIKGQEVIGVYETSDEAIQEGHKRFLLQSFFVHPIRTEEPYVRMRGINYPWRISHFL
jgi:hypothetical protein